MLYTTNHKIEALKQLEKEIEKEIKESYDYFIGECYNDSYSPYDNPRLKLEYKSKEYKLKYLYKLLIELLKLAYIKKITIWENYSKKRIYIDLYNKKTYYIENIDNTNTIYNNKTKQQETPKELKDLESLLKLDYQELKEILKDIK